MWIRSMLQGELNNNCLCHKVLSARGRDTNLLLQGVLGHTPMLDIQGNLDVIGAKSKAAHRC